MSIQNANDPKPPVVPYSHLDWPKWLFHKTKAPTGILVHTPEAAKALGGGYVDSPAVFAPTEVKEQDEKPEPPKAPEAPKK